VPGVRLTTVIQRISFQTSSTAGLAYRTSAVAGTWNIVDIIQKMIGYVKFEEGYSIFIWICQLWSSPCTGGR
jgi:hypothetical protein